MPTIGVLGHTDHGKSALIERLTGVNPMHLPEEKRRGLTIQLGFGFWNTPSGVPVSFIDVPGHERYLRNMLRGVLTIDGALMVVAADDGVMPGTREHLRASLYAPITRGLIVITKTDLVPPERVDEVRETLTELVRGSFWEGAQIVPCSALTGEGVDKVSAALARMCEEVASELVPAPFARFFVDRVFAFKGEGVIVTGSLLGASVKAGDTLYRYPDGKHVKVRSIEQAGEEMPQARTHFRTAFNLSGVKRGDIAVGDLLLSSRAQPCKGQVEALLMEPPEMLRAESPPLDEIARKPQELNAFVGSALIEVKRLQVAPFAEGKYLAQMNLKTKLPLSSGTEVILFRTSTRKIPVGGWLLSIDGIPRGLRRTQMAARLKMAAELLAKAAANGVPTQVQVALAEFALHLAFHGFISGDFRPQLSLLPPERYEEAWNLLAPVLASAGFSESESTYYNPDVLSREVTRLKRQLTGLAEANPLLERVPMRNLLPEGNLLPRLPEAAIREILAEHSLGYEQASVVLPRKDEIPPQWQDAYEDIIARFEGSPTHYPTMAMLKRDYPTSAKLISFLLQREKLVHLGGGVLITGEDWRDWASKVHKWLAKRGKISVGEAKELLHLSRKYVIPLLEDFDKRGFTKREGDARLPGPDFDDFGEPSVPSDC
ncbi:MAG: hypothetical protein B1H03_06630 [Planctomycetales bacterium 4484_113]|nr:MAG: hypothetical protein B1H03_06630 [Planctomycetales bacterium 4484_113]